MSTNEPKSLSALFCDAESPLQDLAQRAAKRLDLTEYLRSCLSPALGDHVLATNLRDDNCLVVLTDSPEWAARLRYEGSTLLSRCREKYPSTARIRFNVAHSQ